VVLAGVFRNIAKDCSMLRRVSCACTRLSFSHEALIVRQPNIRGGYFQFASLSGILCSPWLLVYLQTCSFSTPSIFLVHSSNSPNHGLWWAA
jgi:hypothetical protein